MAFEDGLIHSCNIFSRSTDQQLIYTEGTAVLQPGAILIGEESGATGTVKAVTGSLSSGVLQLSNVVGNFIDGETLTWCIYYTTSDNLQYVTLDEKYYVLPQGTAKASGTNSDYQDEFGQPAESELSSSSICRFFKPQNNMRSGIIDSASGQRFRVIPKVMFPANVDIAVNDRIETNAFGWAGSYTIDDIYPVCGPVGIHHFTADLLKVV